MLKLTHFFIQITSLQIIRAQNIFLPQKVYRTSSELKMPTSSITAILAHNIQIQK